MNTLRILLATLVTTASCASLTPVSLRIDPRVHRKPSASAKVLLVQAPRDLRSPTEVNGADVPFNYALPLLPFFVWAARGSLVTGHEHFVPTAWRELHQSLVGELRSSGRFARVVTEGSATYVLETEVLHLVASMYRASGGFFSLFGSFMSSHEFVPETTVSLRLRLRRGDALVGERVITTRQTSDESAIPLVMHLLIPATLEKALRRARGLVASWVLEEETEALSSAQLLASHEAAHARGHTFVVQRLDPDRRTTHLITIECPSGKVRSSRAVDDLPALGVPGEDLLSPFDDDGAQLPRKAYDALSHHLASYFNLQRIDQLTAYHFFGPRPTSTATVRAPASPTPDTPKRSSRRRSRKRTVERPTKATATASARPASRV